MHQGQGENPIEFPLEYTHKASKEVLKSFDAEFDSNLCLFKVRFAIGINLFSLFIFI